MKNAMELKKMSEAEMEAVVGGTVGQLDELVSACAKNPVVKHLAGLGSHIPGTSNLTATKMEDLLGKLGIKADISVGFCGTGINSKNNTYFDTRAGRSLTHSEVVQRVAEYAI